MPLTFSEVKKACNAMPDGGGRSNPYHIIYLKDDAEATILVFPCAEARLRPDGGVVPRMELAIHEPQDDVRFPCHRDKHVL